MHPAHRQILPLLFAASLVCPALCWAAADQASAAREPAGAKPFIALLLPLASPDFAPPAEAVQRGCRAALERSDAKIGIQVLRTDESPARVLAEYDAAVGRGASVVIGPMTRTAVTVLAEATKAGVPTITLNSPEGNPPLPPRFYLFGLSAEAEGRLIARTAFAERMRSAVVVQAATPLARRVSQAFAREWFSLGGRIPEVQEFGAQTHLVQMQQSLAQASADMIFLSAEADQARRVRPFLNNQTPAFATSLVYDGKADALGNADLNGLRFVDMPWLIQPDHPAVMAYARPENLAPELQRFYALGIDACRVALEIAQDRSSFTLDGVTGWITVGAGPVIEREPSLATFRDGAGVALEEQGGSR